MSSKTLRKQLLAAVAMVIVAAIAVTSSTFAWFAANTSVTASSVQISASSDQPFLQIAAASSGAYGTTATLSSGNTAADLKLTTPLNLSGSLVSFKATEEALDSTAATTTAAATPAAVKWGTAYSSETDEVQAANIPWDVTADAAEYVLHTTVYLRTAENSSGYELKLAPCTVTAGTNTISDAFRILAVAADGKWMLYDAGTNAVTACSAGYLVATVAEQDGTTYTAETTYNAIDIFVYFDGTDTASYTDNATDLSNVSSTLAFTCQNAPTPVGP